MIRVNNVRKYILKNIVVLYKISKKIRLVLYDKKLFRYIKKRSSLEINPDNFQFSNLR